MKSKKHKSLREELRCFLHWLPSLMSDSGRYVCEIYEASVNEPENIRRNILKNLHLRMGIFILCANALLICSLLNIRAIAREEPLAAIVFLLGSPLSFYGATIGILYHYYKQIYLFSLGTACKAKLTKIERQKTKESKYNPGRFVLDYTYTSEDGVVHEAQAVSEHHMLKKLSQMPKAGDEIDIYYDPKKPDVSAYARPSKFIQFCIKKDRVGALTPEEEKLIKKGNNRSIFFIVLFFGALPISIAAIIIILVITHGLF